MKSFSNPPESWYHVQISWGQDLDRDDIAGDAEEAQRARQDALHQELNHGVAHDDYLGVKPGSEEKFWCCYVSPLKEIKKELPMMII